jgi:hypothetical protein
MHYVGSLLYRRTAAENRKVEMVEFTARRSDYCAPISSAKIAFTSGFENWAETKSKLLKRSNVPELYHRLEAYETGQVGII